MYPRASVSADRINEVLETETKVKDGKFSGKTKKEGEVEFKNVSFMYPDSQEYVLKTFRLRLRKGSRCLYRKYRFW